MLLMPNDLDIKRSIDAIYRRDSGKVLATLTHLLGDLDLAEDAMQDAFAAALDSTIKRKRLPPFIPR